MGRENITDRFIFMPFRQAHSEGQLAPGNRHCVLAWWVRMFNPVTYAIRSSPELTEEGMLRERLGAHGRCRELFCEGVSAAHHLDPLARDVEVRITDGPLLADFEEIGIVTGAHSLVHARANLLGRLPGSEGGGVHEVDDLSSRDVLGEQPSPLSSLGYPFVCQRDVAHVRGNLAVTYPMNPYGRQ